ncbi:hypothetical protein XA68_15075 [Ophiocordyceps unilateralis]|uniref:PLAC8 family protein n=1 Tax=Ophiocordyceps unilateralis TaxID=268505 RepID=A0A2A9PLL7_OPHUN|nr:hypothetical protein XA68_15075 [Ophiocordyceps unilateralis]
MDHTINTQQQQQQQPPPPPREQDSPPQPPRPQTQDHQAHHDQHRWSSNICDCSPCESCLLAFCLPCLIFGRTASRMRDPSMQSHSEVNGDCVVFALIHYFTGCGWVYNTVRRGEIRHKYNIKGNCCDDYCASFWCLCCSLIQQDREVRLRTAGLVTDGYDGNKERMHMPAPAYNQDPPQQQQPLMEPAPVAQDSGTLHQMPPQPPPPSKETRP